MDHLDPWILPSHKVGYIATNNPSAHLVNVNRLARFRLAEWAGIVKSPDVKEIHLFLEEREEEQNEFEEVAKAAVTTWTE